MERPFVHDAVHRSRVALAQCLPIAELPLFMTSSPVEVSQILQLVHLQRRGCGQSKEGLPFLWWWLEFSSLGVSLPH